MVIYPAVYWFALGVIYGYMIIAKVCWVINQILASLPVEIGKR